jgi:hypothetical protein
MLAVLTLERTLPPPVCTSRQLCTKRSKPLKRVSRLSQYCSRLRTSGSRGGAGRPAAVRHRLSGPDGCGPRRGATGRCPGISRRAMGSPGCGGDGVAEDDPARRCGRCKGWWFARSRSTIGDRLRRVSIRRTMMFGRVRGSGAHRRVPSECRRAPGGRRERVPIDDRLDRLEQNAIHDLPAITVDDPLPRAPVHLARSSGCVRTCSIVVRTARLSPAGTT